MKSIIVTCLISAAFALSVSATTVDTEKKWHAVIEAISMVESTCNPKAVSSDGKYVGYLQISKILVRECNRILGKETYTYDDRYDKQKSIEMFIIYQERYNPEGNIEKAIRLWNSGDVNCMNRKAATNGYYNRVMRKFTAQATVE